MKYHFFAVLLEKIFKKSLKMGGHGKVQAVCSGHPLTTVSSLVNTLGAAWRPTNNWYGTL